MCHCLPKIRKLILIFLIFLIRLISLGWYEIVYDDGFKEIVPIQYGVNILEWNPGGKIDLIREREKQVQPRIYIAIMLILSICSPELKNNPITFFAFEWVNPRFGKRIKEVNLHGSVNYQALQQDYGKPVTEPMKSNAIFWPE